MLQEKIGEIVAKDLRAAEVFKNHDIDFCCGGGVTLQRAAQKRGLDPELLIEEINTKISNQNTNITNYIELSNKEIIDTIINKYHNITRKNLDFITPILDKVARVHGDRHPELIKVKEIFEESKIDLLKHMKEEEEKVFPKILQLSDTNDTETIESIVKEINSLIDDHELEGNRYRVLKELTNGFTPPKDACNTYLLTFYKLKEFKEILEEHVHLENNILFKKIF